MKYLLIFTLLIFPITLKAKDLPIAEVEEQVGCSNVYSSLVFVEDNGEILHSERSRQISYPASLVKLMTAYLTFEALENKQITPNQKITISGRGEEISKVNKINTLHVVEGDQITVRQAIRGTIVKSFNEAAVTLGEAIAGNEWNFARLMNKKAKELGMINTSYRNASGLHAEGQYTTTYDLARLAIALRKDFPQYYHIFSQKEFTFNKRRYKTHNHVLVDYKGAEGMKTGFTNASGFNLVAAAKKDGSRIISVLLGCESYKKRDDYTKDLLDEAFLEKAANDNKIKVKLIANFDYSQNPVAKILDEDRQGMVLFGSLER